MNVEPWTPFFPHIALWEHFAWSFVGFSQRKATNPCLRFDAWPGPTDSWAKWQSQAAVQFGISSPWGMNSASVFWYAKWILASEPRIQRINDTIFLSNCQSIFKRLVLKPKKTTKRNSCNQIVPRQGDIQFFQDFVAVGKIHLTFRKRS